jgi:hypothetical protein
MGSMKNLNITSKNSLNIKSISDIVLQSGTTTSINATTDVNIAGANINLPGSPEIASTASPAIQVDTTIITDHMIRPNHEPWIRDEDEAKCTTKRNSKYQG